MDIPKLHACDLRAPGHFIGAPECEFWLHSHTGPYDRWCISTVGEYRPEVRGSNRLDGRIHEIGYKRFYETMVFDRMEACLECEDPNAKFGDPRRTNRWMELDCAGYKIREEAEDGHKAMVEKWSKMEIHERNAEIDD